MDTALRICLLSKNAQVPVRATPGSAGYDLFSAVDTVIEAHDKACISTDVQLAIPSGMYGRIAPRSSLAWKHHINVGAGVIDSDYRGNVRVILFNHGVVPVKIAIGDRIAQLILERIAILPIVVVTTLDETQRGEGGFGSTGTGVVLPLSEADKKDLLQTKRQKVE